MMNSQLFAPQDKPSSLSVEKHVRPFYSLDEVSDDTGLRRYYKRFAVLREKFSSTAVDFYYLDCRLTGVPVQIFYAHGRLESALTKYNGREGEDVTEVVKLLPNVPQKINTQKSVVIRGEIVIHKDDFYAINQDRESAGLTVYDKMSDCVEDVIRSNDLQLVIKYILRFYGWELFVLGEKELEQQRQIDLLMTFGFNTPKGQICTSIQEMSSFINEIARIRNRLPYEIDGVIIKQNDPAYRKAIGVKDGIELSKCVWRFNEGGVVCTLKNIEWRVTHTGKVEPFGILKPICINGVLVNEISLRNIEYVRNNYIGNGAKLILDRNGENEPAIVKILKLGNAEEIPCTCPSCGHELTFAHSNVYCRNPECPAILEATLNFIMGGDILNYPSFTPELVHEVVASKTVVNLLDVFSTLETKSDKISQRVLDDLVTKMRSINLLDLIMMLGIPGMGRAIAGKLASEVGTVSGLIDILNNDEYFRLLNISSVVKQYFADWYTVPENKLFLERLKDLNLPRCS